MVCPMRFVLLGVSAVLALVAVTLCSQKAPSVHGTADADDAGSRAGSNDGRGGLGGGRRGALAASGAQQVRSGPSVGGSRAGLRRVMCPRHDVCCACARKVAVGGGAQAAAKPVEAVMDSLSGAALARFRRFGAFATCVPVAVFAWTRSCVY